MQTEFSEHRTPAWEPGSRHEKAPSRDLHKVLDLPLVVSLARSPKTLLEQVVRLRQHPADLHPRLAEVRLGVPRRMGQRHEHLALRGPLQSPAKSCSSRSRSKIRWAVCRCFFGSARSVSRIWSMIGV